MDVVFSAAVFGFLVLCVPAFLLFRFSVFLLLCFFAFLLFLLLCLSTSLLFCFPFFCCSAFLLSAFPAFCFSFFLLFLLICFSAFVLLCLSTSTILLCLFFSHVFCCSTSCSSASLLPVFTVSVLFFFSFALFSPVCILNETLKTLIQRNPQEILIRTPDKKPLHETLNEP